MDDTTEILQGLWEEGKKQTAGVQIINTLRGTGMTPLCCIILLFCFLKHNKHTL